MDTIKISFLLDSSKDHCPFVFEIAVDGNTVETVNGFDQSHVCAVEIADDDSDHVLEIRMQGKTSDHTKISEDGTILDDILVTVKDLQIDEIDLGYVFQEHSEYSHDFNGTGTPTTESFVGVMGCNGVVRFKFSTPAYLWLLENL